MSISNVSISFCTERIIFDGLQVGNGLIVSTGESESVRGTVTVTITSERTQAAATTVGPQAGRGGAFLVRCGIQVAGRQSVAVTGRQVTVAAGAAAAAVEFL